MTLNIPTSVVRELPLGKLVPSKDNVRRTDRAASVDELAASILAHGLLQNLTVRPEINDEGRETGKYEVTAGGRRLAALKLLAGQKKIAKNAPIACNVREDGIARELSLVENVQRVALHPADQFEAFRELHEDHGLGADEIAARFGVTPRTVKERLKLGAVSPKLLAQYRAGDLTLDQIMAFAVIDDHARQEEVRETLTYNKSPDMIRRQLLQSHVPAHDKRALFVGLEAYEAAGGVILRDLFADDDGGYLTDPGLLDRLARSKLDEVAAQVEIEGWKWVETAPDFPHGHGLRPIYQRDVELGEADIQRLEELENEIDALGAEIEEEPNAEKEATLAALNAEYEQIDGKGRGFDPDEMARAGAFVTIGHDGELDIVRGFVKPEDERKPELASGDGGASDEAPSSQGEGDDESASPLSDRLIADLTAQRTMALRDALGADVGLGIAALTHALALQAFYPYGGSRSCLEITLRSVALDGYAPGIGDSIAARHITARHEDWAARTPKEPTALWAFVQALQGDEQLALLAHCAALSVNDVSTGGHAKGRYTHADAVATKLGLDMRRYWTPTASSYLGRVSKPMILEAVREGASEEAAARIANFKKADMAHAAEQLLDATPWLPEILRTRPIGSAGRDEGGAQIAEAAE